MPAASHFIYALSLVIPLIILFPKDENGKSKINRMALAIYVLNNYIGPDSYWVYSFFPINGHTFLGYVIWSIPLSLFYSYLSRFRLLKNKKATRINYKFSLEDTQKYSVDWKNAYFLTFAGGCSHFFIDMIGHITEPIFLAPNVITNLDVIQSWGYSYYHQLGAISIIGYLILFGFSFLLLYYIEQDLKDMVKFFFGFIIAVYLAIFIFGGEVFGELELSTSFLIFLFFTIPNTLLFYALSDLSKEDINAADEVDQREVLHEEVDNRLGLKKFYLSGLFILTISVILFGFSLFAIFNSKVIGDIFIFDPKVIAQAAVLTLIISIILIGLTVLMLAVKSNFARISLVIIMGLLFALIIPVTIALMLNEKDVKQIFAHKVEPRQND